MGVKGLWKIVNGAGKVVTLEDLRGKTLAIDTSIWLTKYVTVYSNYSKKRITDEASARFSANTSSTDLQRRVLSAFFKRICKLLYFNVKPIFVFDGATPELKSKTVELRRVHRATATDRRNAKNRQRLLQSFIAKQLQAKQGVKPAKTMKQTNLDKFVERPVVKDEHADLRKFALNQSDDELRWDTDSDVDICSGSDSFGFSSDSGTDEPSVGRSSDSDSVKVLSSSGTADAEGFSKQHLTRIVQRELSKQERERAVERRVLRRTGIEDADKLLSAARANDRLMVLVRTRRKSENGEDSSPSKTQDEPVEINSSCSSDSSLKDQTTKLKPASTIQLPESSSKQPTFRSIPARKVSSDVIIVSNNSDSDSSTSTEDLVEVDVDFELATQRAIELSRAEAEAQAQAESQAITALSDKPAVVLSNSAVESEAVRSPVLNNSSSPKPSVNLQQSPSKSPRNYSTYTNNPPSNPQSANTEHGELERALRTILEAFGIPSIRARGEADAECAMLNRYGLADGVVTEDGDCLLLGARTVYRNIFDRDREPLQFDAVTIQHYCALSRARLVFYALLAGCDYSAGVRGCGAGSALRLARHFVPLPDSDSSRKRRQDAAKETVSIDENDVTETLREATVRFREAVRNGAALADTNTKTTSSRRKRERVDNKVDAVLRKLAASFSSNADEVINERALFAFGDPLREAGERDVEEYVASRRAILQWSVPDLDSLRRVAFSVLGWTSATVDPLALDAIRRVREFEAMGVDQQPRINDFMAASRAEVRPDSPISVKEQPSPISVQSNELSSDDADQEDGSKAKAKGSKKNRPVQSADPTTQRSLRTRKTTQQASSEDAHAASAKVAPAKAPKRGSRTKSK